MHIQENEGWEQSGQNDVTMNIEKVLPFQVLSFMSWNHNGPKLSS